MKPVMIFFVLFFFSSSLLSQYNDSNLKQYINTFKYAKIKSESKIQEVMDDNQTVIDRLSAYDLKVGALAKYIESLSLNDFLEILAKRDKAYEEDLYKPAEFSLKHDEDISNKFMKDSIRFGIYEQILRSHLEFLYAESIASLIMSPVILKVKIKSIENETYEVYNDENIGLIIVNAEIEDIIKGSKHFNTGQLVKFYYIPFWVNREIILDINKSYFLSLLPVIDSKYGVRRLALNVNEKNGGVSLISENKLLDKENCYNLGVKLWLDFKEKISSLININLLKGE